MYVCMCVDASLSVSLSWPLPSLPAPLLFFFQLLFSFFRFLLHSCHSLPFPILLLHHPLLLLLIWSSSHLLSHSPSPDPSPPPPSASLLAAADCARAAKPPFSTFPPCALPPSIPLSTIAPKIEIRLSSFSFPPPPSPSLYPSLPAPFLPPSLSSSLRFIPRKVARSHTHTNVQTDMPFFSFSFFWYLH